MQVSIEQLELMFPNANDKLRLKFLNPVNATLREFGINTRLRAAAFLAQVAHESGEFRYVEEIASGAAYNNRSDLGNTRPEAIEIARLHDTQVGCFYKGRGLLQCTGYINYLQLSKDLGVDVVNEPGLLTKPLLAARSAGWFWKKHKLNDLADQDRFSAITRIINGGYNGRAERLAYYRNNLKVLSA